MATVTASRVWPGVGARVAKGNFGWSDTEAKVASLVWIGPGNENILLTEVSFQRDPDVNLWPVQLVNKTDKSPTVFVIDDDQSVRTSIANLVRSVGMEAELFASTDEFLAQREWPRPGCLVLDVRLPGRSGLDFQDDLARAKISMPIVFISGHADVPMSVRAMKAGAVEFIVKPVRPQDLLDAIQAGVARDAAQSRDACVEEELRAKFSTLSAREREVLNMVTRGLMNKQIAAALEISEATVKMHRASVMRKMNAASVPDLVRMADKLPGPLPGDT